MQRKGHALPARIARASQQQARGTHDTEQQRSVEEASRNRCNVTTGIAGAGGEPLQRRAAQCKPPSVHAPGKMKLTIRNTKAAKRLVRGGDSSAIPMVSCPKSGMCEKLRNTGSRGAFASHRGSDPIGSSVRS